MQVKNEIKNTKDKTIKKQNNLPWHGQFTVKKKKYKKKNLRRHLKIIGSGRHRIYKNICFVYGSSMLPKYNLTQETESHTPIKIE